MSLDTITARRRRLLAAVIALACGLATPVSAKVYLEGDLNALRITASGDALSDVLTTLGARWPVRYRSSVLLNVEIAGAYSGSLSQVVARLLDGYNYVIRRDGGLTEIIVFGARGEAVVAPRVNPVKGVLSRWR